MIDLIATIVTLLGTLAVGSIVFFHGRRKTLHVIFALLNLSIALWTIANFLSLNVDDNSLILFWIRMTMFLAVMQSLTFFLFIHTFPNPQLSLKKQYKWVLLIMSAITSFIAFTPLIFKDIERDPSGAITPIPGIGMILFIPNSIGLILLGIIILINKLRKSRGLVRLQLNYILVGSVIMFFLLIFFNFVLVNFFRVTEYVDLGAIYILPFVMLTAYSIVRYRLMDIRLVIKRSVVYSILIALIAAVFFGTGKLVSGPLEYINPAAQDGIFIITGLVLVFVFQPARRLLDKATDKIFFRDKINYQEILRRISAVISFEIDFDNLTRFLVEELANELKVQDAFIFLANKSGNGMTLEASSNTKIQRNRILPESTLLKELRENRNLIIREEFYRKLDDTDDETTKTTINGILQEMESLKADLALPIIVEGRLTAAIVLGEKRSGDIFSYQDLNLLELLSQQLGTALQRARLYKEVRDFNKKLRREVTEATSELQVVNLSLQERNNFLLALQRITSLMTSSLDYKKVVNGIVDGIAKEIRFVGGALFLLDEQKQEVYVEAISHTVFTRDVMKLLPKKLSVLRASLDNPQSLTLKAIREGEIQIANKLTDFAWSMNAAVLDAIQKKAHIQSIVAVPIKNEDRTVGALVYYLDIPPEKIGEPHKQVMRSLADQTGIVTQNLHLYEEIQHINIKLRDANDHLKELDDAKSEFMSIASHQLRTPLSGIMGYLSMLVEGDYGKFTKDQRVVLDNVLNASKRMIRLVNVFLNITRIEAGRLHLERTKVNMNDLVTHVINELRPPAKSKNIALSFTKSAKLSDVWVDQDKMSDVILNLTDNAIKYTEKGSIVLTTEEDGGVIRVKVKDTGVGIQPDEAKRLFEKFVRGTGIARVQPDGSGLGLFIAKKIVEAHKGKVWVESEGEGKGSTFIFELPVKLNGPDASKTDTPVKPLTTTSE